MDLSGLFDEQFPADHTKSLSALIDGLSTRHESMVETLWSWSQVNSGSYNMAGLTQMGDIIDDAFAVLGGELTLLEPEDGVLVSDKGEVGALPYGPVHHFRKRPQAPRRILLTGHLDTVFPADFHFQEPQWLDDKTINGPGVADMKGGLLVMLEALKVLEASPLAAEVGWDILVSSDEEIGSIGSGPFLSDFARGADIGMTYEPALADGTLAGARKGSGNFTIVMRGKAAHAGREFHEGRNAVMALSSLITELWALNGKRDGVTINPAKISGGTAPNIVPDVAVCRLNIRLKEREDEAWAMDHLERLCGHWNAQEGFACELYGEFNRPPKPLSQANERLFEAIKQCGRALDLNIAYKATGGCCEGNNLAAAGLPNVDTLGVRGGLIHSDQEFVLVDSLVERAQLSALVMLSFASGRFDDLLRSNR